MDVSNSVISERHDFPCNSPFQKSYLLSPIGETTPIPDIIIFSLFSIICFVLIHFVFYAIRLIDNKIGRKEKTSFFIGEKDHPWENEFKDKLFSYWLLIFILIILLIICIKIWLIPVSIFSITPIPIPGQLFVDMKNANINNDTAIHASIKITGPDTGLSIKLFKEESGHLNPIAILDNIDPQYKINSISNKSLFVYSLGSGKYSVLINTTFMPKGYYQLKFDVPNYETIYYIGDFYLT